jgi:hypothetical protein
MSELLMHDRQCEVLIEEGEQTNQVVLVREGDRLSGECSWTLANGKRQSLCLLLY